MKKITADYIFSGKGNLQENTVLITDDVGRIVKLDKLENHEPQTLEKYSGLLCPGFINTHCHLELSHMVGKVDSGTSLIPFLQSVVQFRDFPAEIIQDAIAKQDEAMFENGIMAVGDISNKTDTFKVKAESPIRYYTFVEMFNLMQEAWTETEFEKYKTVYDQLEANEKDDFRAVPHAPYSVTKRLFEKINALNPAGGTISIHNQETPAENRFFENKTGDFIDFYKGFDLPLSDFKPSGKRSIHYALEHMDPKQKTLLVHNTTCIPEDIKAAHQWSENIYWATCPNANLYIENRLPNYKYFLEAKARMTIGTDSLTSNWKLSILDELKTIQRFQSYVPLESLLQWATSNGAEALGFDDTLGSFEPGKQPGVLNILIDANQKFTSDSRVNRII